MRRNLQMRQHRHQTPWDDEDDVTMPRKNDFHELDDAMKALGQGLCTQGTSLAALSGNSHARSTHRPQALSELLTEMEKALVPRDEEHALLRKRVARNEFGVSGLETWMARYRQQRPSEMVVRGAVQGTIARGRVKAALASQRALAAGVLGGAVLGRAEQGRVNAVQAQAEADAASAARAVS